MGRKEERKKKGRREREGRHGSRYIEGRHRKGRHDSRGTGRT